MKYPSHTPKKQSTDQKRSNPQTPDPQAKRLTGSFTLTANGYGFVKPERSDLPDIFIPPRETKGALTLDYVEIQAHSNGKNRLSGRVVKILKRRSNRLVGSLLLERKQWFLCEQKSARRFPLLLLPESPAPIQGGIAIARFQEDLPEPSPHKNNRRSGALAKRNGQGETDETPTLILERLVGETSFTDYREAILAEFGLSRDFPEAVLKEMAALTQGDRDQLGFPMRDRIDLTKKPIVTIDGADAKDFDDAVYAEPLPSGGYRLWVSIADVSAYVAEESATNEEAFTRGTSTYFPGFALPMLPEKLSNHLCSLVPHEDRLTLTAEITLSVLGEPVKTEIYPSIIRSHARLTYDEVERFLTDRKNAPASITEPIATSLSLLKEIAEKRIVARTARGSLEFDLPEAVFVLDSDLNPIDTRRSTRLFAHRLIEECMILANEEVATYVEKHHLPGLFRVHDRPDTTSLMHFLEFAEHYRKTPESIQKRAEKGSEKKPRRGSRHARKQEIDATHTTPARAYDDSLHALQAILNECRGKPHEPFMMKLLLRSLKQAVYDETNTGHFGLASEAYLHFTSPIRRYPDLHVHRLLRKYLMRKTAASKKEKAEAIPSDPIGFLCSHRERVSMEAEREMNKLYSVAFMRDKLGRCLSGRVSHATPFGLFVLFDDFFVEGFVSKEALASDAIFDQRALAWVCKRSKRRYELGQTLRVQVASASLADRRVTCILDDTTG